MNFYLTFEKFHKVVNGSEILVVHRCEKCDMVESACSWATVTQRLDARGVTCIGSYRVGI